MTKKLNWRLSKLPTPDEVRELVKDKIITQDEARGILFSSETEEERDKKSLESEIKFLRELVEKLSSSKTTIIETIREVQKPYHQYAWYKPYEVWCSASNSLNPANSTTTSTSAFYCGSDDTVYTASSGSNFSAIATF